MTPFVESFATQQLLPPWRAMQAHAWRFAIRLGEDQVRDYLDLYFNGAYPDQAPFAYAPLPGPQFGLLSACYFPSIESLQRGEGGDPVSGGDPWDLIRHTEVYFAFPVLRYAVGPDGLMTQPSLVWVQPFIYSDNDTIVFSSREIWGADMFLTTIVRDETLPPDALHLDVGMVGVKRFSPRSVDELLACLHISAVTPTGLALPDILGANPDLKAFADILAGSGQFADGQLPPGVRQGDYPEGVALDNLKQFRDCYDMGAAIYRAIVACRTSFTNVSDLVFFDAAEVDIAFMFSDTLAEMLRTIFGAGDPNAGGPPPAHIPGGPGATSEGMDWEMDRVVLKAELAFAFHADIDFEVLGTLHTYGASA